MRLFYTDGMNSMDGINGINCINHMKSKHSVCRSFSPWITVCLLVLSAVAMTSCAATPAGDPLQSLARTEVVPSRQIAAMAILDNDPTNPEYLKALRKIVVQPNFVRELRDEAWNRLVRYDIAGLKNALELNLPKMQMYEWRTEVCKRIGDLGWKDMTPTLVRAWAVVLPILGSNLMQRPEYFALVKLWGKDGVPQKLFDLMLKSDPIKESNLRSRCWELLLATGERARILALLSDESIASTDSFILDMRRSASDIGVLPRNREEILWIRALRVPQKRAFWDAVRAAAAQLRPEVRDSLEPRDLSVLVAAAKYRPELLSASRDELFDEITVRLTKQRTSRHSVSFEGYGEQRPETPHGHAKEMDWGDCAAVVIALAAINQPEVCAHIFDIADRDQADRLTEYGGLMRLDEQSRFELIEYPPQNRGSDVRFNASNEMFEQGYDALFHFHNHAQAYDNRRYAGPHLGDFAYADATGVNGLVFTFIDRNTINADYYRRGNVVIDLGTIRRPEK